MKNDYISSLIFLKKAKSASRKSYPELHTRSLASEIYLALHNGRLKNAEKLLNKAAGINDFKKTFKDVDVLSIRYCRPFYAKQP